MNLCFSESCRLFKQQGQSLFPVTFFLEHLIQTNLNANLVRRLIVTSQAVLDHLAVECTVTESNDKGRIIVFYSGGERLPFLGLADNFFLKNNAFQTTFFITFCNENNFLRAFNFKNITGFF